jgi:hypothetical protein
MAANRGAIDHVLPVIGKSQIDQRLQQGIPIALLRPAPSLGWRQRADQFSLGIRQVPTAHDGSPKRSLESERLGNPLVNTAKWSLKLRTYTDVTFGLDM